MRSRWIAALAVFAGLALMQGASTRVVVQLPEILELYVNGAKTNSLSVRALNGTLSPEKVSLKVISTTNWQLWVSATPLVGPWSLSPAHIRIGGYWLSAIPQLIAQEWGSWRAVYLLAVSLSPVDKGAALHSLILFRLVSP